MNTLYILTGQTATGKTDYAIKLAQKVDGEIINFDSRQIYKHLDIVTGKDVLGAPFTETKAIDGKTLGYYSIGETKLWLYDIVEPNKSFSSFDFEQSAIPLIKQLLAEGKTPILVGGTYLYIYYLLYGEKQEAQQNYNLRYSLNSLSVEQLRDILEKERPGTIVRLNESDRKNPHRIIRLIEGKKVTESLKFEFTVYKKLGIDKNELDISIEGWKHTSPDTLRNALEKRVQKRLMQGAVDEVKKILQLGYDESCPGLQGIGYKQIISYIKNEIDMNQLRLEWVIKEYQYAKRQLTFMKRDSHIKWHIV